MTYTLILNGGKEIQVDHQANPVQLEGIIKQYQGAGQWMKIFTPEGEIYLDALAVQGYRPHGGSTATFGDKPTGGEAPS